MTCSLCRGHATLPTRSQAWATSQLLVAMAARDSSVGAMGDTGSRTALARNRSMGIPSTGVRHEGIVQGGLPSSSLHGEPTRASPRPSGGSVGGSVGRSVGRSLRRFEGGSEGGSVGGVVGGAVDGSMGGGSAGGSPGGLAGDPTSCRIALVGEASSLAPCELGRSYGCELSHDGVPTAWVQSGCRGRFECDRIRIGPCGLAGSPLRVRCDCSADRSTRAARDEALLVETRRVYDESKTPLLLQTLPPAAMTGGAGTNGAGTGGAGMSGAGTGRDNRRGEEGQAGMRDLPAGVRDLPAGMWDLPAGCSQSLETGWLAGVHESERYGESETCPENTADAQHSR